MGLLQILARLEIFHFTGTRLDLAVVLLMGYGFLTGRRKKESVSVTDDDQLINETQEVDSDNN